MSASPANFLIFNPLEDSQILEEEQLALALPNVGFSQPLAVIPWRSLLLSGKLDLVRQIPKERCRATILTFELEQPEIQNLMAEMGFQILFCTSTSKKWPIRNFAYPDFISDRMVNNPDKNIEFSLVAWRNNSLRRSLFRRFSDIPSVIKRDSYGFGLEQGQQANTNEYIDILSRSRFSLCPRGIGTGTKRIWESLRAGAIPIIISDGWEPPSCWDWSDTAIFIEEWRAKETFLRIPSAMILPKGREELMRANCLKAADAFTDPLFLANYIESILSGTV